MAIETASKVEVRPGAESKTRALSPFDEFENFFDNVFGRRSWLRPLALAREWPALEKLDARLPKVDVVERDKEIVVRAEVPGVDKKDLEISVTENTVTIKGSTMRQEKEEKGDYYRCEISQGAFARVVGLPSDVNSDEAKASFKDGILEITAPKKQAAKRRNILVE
ncbi:MAG: Hsp20/alpha crystallin family protein [Pseudomonadota bacterium]